MELNTSQYYWMQTINGLNIRPDGIYVDGTLGEADMPIKSMHTPRNKGSNIGIDQDAAAIRLQAPA